MQTLCLPNLAAHSMSSWNVTFMSFMVSCIVHDWHCTWVPRILGNRALWYITVRDLVYEGHVRIEEHNMEMLNRVNALQALTILEPRNL